MLKDFACAIRSRRTQQLMAAVAGVSVFAMTPRKAEAQTISFGGNYIQDFNTLPSTGTFTAGVAPGPIDFSGPTIGATGMTGWYLAKNTGTGTNVLFTVNNGTANSGAIYSYGATGATNRAVGALASGTFAGIFGAVFVNNTGSTLTSLNLSYTGEQWRQGGGSEPVNTLTFNYSTNSTGILDTTGTFLGSTSLDISSLHTGVAVTALDGTAATNQISRTGTLSGFNWAPGATLVIKWTDVNDTGNDDGLAIDDLTVSIPSGLGARNIVWTGGTTHWNTTDSNWLNGATPTSFTNTDNVQFGNTGVGSVIIDSPGVSPGSVTVSNTAGTYTFSGGPILGSAVITKSGAGTLLLTSANSNAGVIINGGIVGITSDAALGTSNAVLTLGGGTLRTDTNVTIARNVLMTGGSNGSTVDNGGYSSTLSGGISGAGNLAFAGSGTTTLSGSLGFSGSVSVNAGTLVLASGSGATVAFSAPGSAGAFAGNIVVSNSVRFNVLGGIVSGGGNIQFQAPNITFGLNGSSNTTEVDNNILLNSTGLPGGTSFTTYLAVTGGNFLTINGTMSGNSDVNFGYIVQTSGAGGVAGSITLGGHNTYTGTTYINSSLGGLVKDGINDALPTNTALIFGNITNSTTVGPGSLDLNGYNQTIGALSTGAYSNAASARITNGGITNSTLTVNTGSSNLNAAPYLGVLTDGVNGGTLALVKAGTGTLSLGGTRNSNYSGGVFINGGTLSITGDNVLGLSTSPVTINNGTLLASTNVTVTHPIVLNHVNSTIDASPTMTLELQGSLSGSNLTKGPLGGTVYLNGTAPVALSTLTATGGTLSIGSATGAPIPFGSNPGGFSPAPTITPGATIGTVTITNNAVVSFATTVGSGSPYVFPYSGTTPTQRITHTIGTLVLPYSTGGSSVSFTGGGDFSGTITPQGTLDIANHQVILNTPTAQSVRDVQLLVAAGYNASNYGAEDGQWNGAGITSSVAKSSFDPGAGVSKYAVGYAYGGDASTQAEQGGGADNTNTSLDGIGPNQTVVRTVLLGDVNMDGVVDFADIATILGYHYNDGLPAHYTDGDINNHGVVNFDDIALVLAYNYNGGQYFPAQSAAQAQSKFAAAKTAKTSKATTLSGSAPAAVAAATPAASSQGATGDNAPDFVYDPSTGDLKFIVDGYIPLTAAGAASYVGGIQINSTHGYFNTTGLTSASSQWTGLTNSSIKIAGGLTQTPGFSDGSTLVTYDLGNILPIGMAITDLTPDLTVKYSVTGNGSLKNADVVLAPEPTSLALLGMGAIGLLGRRRKRESKSTVQN